MATSLEGKEELQICFAEGDSDADSVRDWESGPNPVRWSKRDPYFYRREPNLEDIPYRRRCKVALVAGVGPQWMPEVDSDDDGYVRQKSFMTSSQIEIDPATGEEIGESKDIQGFIASGVVVGGSGRKPWEGEMFRSILDAPLPENGDIPDGEFLASFLDKVQQQVGVSPIAPIEAVDQLWAVIAIGLGQPGIGLKRDSRCPECGLEWNQHPGTLTGVRALQWLGPRRLRTDARAWAHDRVLVQGFEAQRGGSEDRPKDAGAGG